MWIGLILFIVILIRYLATIKLRNLEDSPKNEPILTEHARLHAKDEHGAVYHRYSFKAVLPSAKYIYFYIPERDTVVVCKVPCGVWEYLPKGDWGMLCHQGGKFFSFQRDCDGEIVSPETHSTIYDIYQGGI